MSLLGYLALTQPSTYAEIQHISVSSLLNAPYTVQFKLTVAVVAAALCALPTPYSRPSFSNQIARGRLDLSQVHPDTFAQQICWLICATHPEEDRFGSLAPLQQKAASLTGNIVENLTLCSRNLFPDVVSFETHNYVKFSPYQAITDEHHHELTLTLGQMQKSGIPKLMDSSLADVLLGGEGLMLDVINTPDALLRRSASKDKSSVLKVKKVKVKVDSLQILRPLATGLVKKQIQNLKAIADAIETGLEYVDGQLVSVRDRMRVTMASIKVVMNQNGSVLANRGYPTGWVNRIAEKKEAAVTGEEWRSKA
ncbi:hypothetical protein HGRIS_011182 [Hohenbuehelia grisea]|uniref:Uncharacterized protein n=1 Tax=Hohenbuehelia grisea TaxID=104357 RepID=A0ABR3JUK3_9AGAR